MNKSKSQFWYQRTEALFKSKTKKNKEKESMKCNNNNTNDKE